MRRRRRHRRASAGILTRTLSRLRVLHDRVLIPADWALRIDATLYLHTIQRSFRAIKRSLRRV